MTTTQKTCFWALLSTSNLAFVYLSSSLRNTSTSDKSILGTCLYDYLHPNEYVPAKRDISRSIEQRDLLGSVTRCRFRNIFLSRPLIRSRRKASVAVPSQPDYQGTHQATLPPIPTPPTHSRSPRSYFSSTAPSPHCDRNEVHNTNAPDYDEEEYLVMDIALNVLCDGVVLGIFHPIDDEQREHVCGQQSYDSQDIEHWNQCVRYLSEQNRQLGTSGNQTGVPLTPNTPQSPSSKITSVNSFGTSLSTNATHKEAFCKLTGAQKVPPPGSRGVLEHHLKPEDLRKIKEHLEKPAPSDDRLCIQRYSAKHSLTHMDGSVQYVQCIVIPYGSITFACFQSVAPLLSNFAAQQPLQLSLPPGKRHYTPLNKKVLDNNPVTSFTPPPGTSSVSRLLNHPYTSVPGMPLTPGSPSAQGSSQNPLECSMPEETPNIYSKSSYSYYPRNSHNRASLPSLPTLRNKVSDPNFNANRRASEPHTNFARPRDKTNSIMSSSSLSRIPENQVSMPSPLSPNKRAFKEGPLCQAPIKKFRSEQEDLRVRVLGRNYSEGDIFRPMDHPGSHRRHSSPVTHRDQPQAKGSLPPISQLVEPQTHHSSNGLSYSQSSHPHIMSTPVGVHPQAMNQFRSSTSGIHASPSTQGYAMTRGGVPISFLHSSATVQKRCESCNTSQSPEWRRGPTGHKTLCNACGLRYSRSIARAGKQQQKANAANVTPTSNSNTTRSIPNFTISTPSHSRQPISKPDAYIERTSVHHYPVSHLSYPHSAHIPSTLPSSSGNSRGNR